MGYSLARCESRELWNSFVEASPQFSIFCHSDFLDSLNKDYDLWFFEKDGAPQVALPVIKEAGQPVRAPHPYTLYQGFLFCGKSEEWPLHSRSKWTLDIMSAFLAELENVYSSVSVCQHYRTSDLRALQWFHYSEPPKGRFKLDMLYSGIIDLAPFGAFSDFFGTVRDTRRNEFNQAKTKGLSVQISENIEILNELHGLTFARQGISRSVEEERYLLQISTAALEKGFGELLICQNKEGVPIAANLFLFDSRSAYYLFGAGHPEYRKLNGGTFLFLSSVARCFEKNIKKIDVVGVNSPNRGDFKMSFNASPVLYFLAHWEKPTSK